MPVFVNLSKGVMVIDKLQNAAFYHGLEAHIATGLRFLTKHSRQLPALGRHVIDGDAVYALSQEYQTRPRSAGIWEAHRRYIDIQYIASGSEIMGYAPISSLTVHQPYDEEKDCELFGGPMAESGSFFRMPAGFFAIFTPDDGHMPGLMDGTPVTVQKIVVKVKV
jgi:biofilm protein TabA